MWPRPAPPAPAPAAVLCKFWGGMEVADRVFLALKFAIWCFVFVAFSFIMTCAALLAVLVAQYKEDPEVEARARAHALEVFRT